MRHLYALTTVLALVTGPSVVAAQQVQPAGVVARRTESTKAAPVRTEFPHAIFVDSTQGHPWRWVGTGTLLGAAAGGVVAAVSVSRTDDAFFGGPAIAATTVAGALVGGLLGGLFYLISH